MFVKQRKGSIVPGPADKEAVSQGRERDESKSGKYLAVDLRRQGNVRNHLDGRSILVAYTACDSEALEETGKLS